MRKFLEAKYWSGVGNIFTWLAFYYVYFYMFSLLFLQLVTSCCTVLIELKSE